MANTMTPEHIDALLNERVLLLHYLMEVKRDRKLVSDFIDWRDDLSLNEKEEIINSHDD